MSRNQFIGLLMLFGCFLASQVVMWTAFWIYLVLKGVQ